MGQGDSNAEGIMEIFRNVEEVIIDAVGGDSVTAEQELKTDIGLDSLSLVAVIVGLEEKFGIEFNESDLDPSKIVRVQDLVELVRKYV